MRRSKRLSSMGLPIAFAVGCLSLVKPAHVWGQHKEPILRVAREIRVDGNDLDLVSINAMVVWPDGRVAVSQGLDHAVRFFTAEGRSLGSVGREGDGPGEFRGIGWVGRVADSLWAYDGRTNRLTLFAPDLSLVRSFVAASELQPPSAGTSHTPGFSSLRPRALLPGGWMLAASPGASRDRSVFYRIRAADGLMDRRIATYDLMHGRSGEDAGYFDLPNTVVNLPLPFLGREGIAVSPNGTWVAVAADAENGQDKRSYSVTLIRSSGDTAYTENYLLDRMEIGAESRDSVLDAGVKRVLILPIAGVSGAQKRDLAQKWRAVAARHISGTYPALGGRGVQPHLEVGDDGTVCVQVMNDNPKKVRYEVIDPTGELVGALLLPNNVTILAVSRSRAWGVELDHDDVPSIVRYRFDLP